MEGAIDNWLLKRLSSQEIQTLTGFQSEIPVRIGGLCRQFGLSVKTSILNAGISGEIRKDGDAYVIRVNRYESRERQRFTIAHELSHFLLHRDLIDQTPDGIRLNVLYRSGKSEIVEFEANKLAAEIIMPIRQIRFRLDAYTPSITDEKIRALAKEFAVSKVAMEIRISSL